MSDGAWTPRPFAYVAPLSVSVRPSPAPCSPLLMSFSAGPQPLLMDVHVRSLRYLVDGFVSGGGVPPQVSFASAQSAWSKSMLSPASFTTSRSVVLPVTSTWAVLLALDPV